jgi:SlyX protein
MTDYEKLAARCVDLESHLAHHERMIQDLSDMVAGQWDTINRVLGKLERLEARLQASQDQEIAAEEPPPPHY